LCSADILPQLVSSHAAFIVEIEITGRRRQLSVALVTNAEHSYNPAFIDGAETQSYRQRLFYEAVF
jgi:hypothetical protein